QSHTPCNRCVRFATTVASGHATLATKRTLLLTWAGLAPAGSHQLCLAHSLNHLVGERQQLVGNLEAKRLRGLDVNHRVQLGWLHARQDGRLGCFENLPGIHSDLAKCFGEVCAVGDEPPGSNVFAPIINRGNFEVCRQHDNLMKSAEEEWVCAYNECAAS